MLTPNHWGAMGCGYSSDSNGVACSEFDCMSRLGQSNGNAAFQKHWDTWITPADIQSMHDVGLNTIRIPLGYWIDESLVDSSEHFPQGALTYLDALVGKASDLGMYIILDFHGAPMGQKDDAFTGQVGGFFCPFSRKLMYIFSVIPTLASIKPASTSGPTAGLPG